MLNINFHLILVAQQDQSYKISSEHMRVPIAPSGLQTDFKLIRRYVPLDGRRCNYAGAQVY